jgi:hypothetical protein
MNSWVGKQVGEVGDEAMMRDECRAEQSRATHPSPSSYMLRPLLLYLHTASFQTEIQTDNAPSQPQHLNKRPETPPSSTTHTHTHTHTATHSYTRRMDPIHAPAGADADADAECIGMYVGTYLHHITTPSLELQLQLQLPLPLPLYQPSQQINTTAPKL